MLNILSKTILRQYAYGYLESFSPSRFDIPITFGLLSEIDGSKKHSYKKHA
jgi:hypothetical protein